MQQAAKVSLAFRLIRPFGRSGMIAFADFKAAYKAGDDPKAASVGFFSAR
jgi:hypothetical protein